MSEKPSTSVWCIVQPDHLLSVLPTFCLPTLALVLFLLQVLARSSPTDKFNLVKLLKKQGDIVAVTGDFASTRLHVQTCTQELCHSKLDCPSLHLQALCLEACTPQHCSYKPACLSLLFQTCTYQLCKLQHFQACMSELCVSRLQRHLQPC